MTDPRYNSGTPLVRTDKERRLEAFEAALRTEFDDRTFAALKKLPVFAISRLHVAVQKLVAKVDAIARGSPQ
jgi:hypothetical protein